MAQLPEQFFATRLRRTALADWLTRRFGAEANRASAAAAGQARGWHGAKGGDVVVDVPGQYVLERTSVLVSPEGAVEARFTVGLPAQVWRRARPRRRVGQLVASARATPRTAPAKA